MKYKLSSILILILSFNIGISQSAEEQGLAIAIAADKADEGFASNSVDLKMTLKNSNGQVSERYMTSKTLELTADGDKSMIVFNSPKDVKGTATMTFTHKIGSDDQWLFLPSIKRVKRISSNNKSGPFMGSEFAFEDLSSQEVEKYDYKLISREGDFAIVEQDPKDKKSGYTRRLTTYNVGNGYRVEKIEFYDRKNALLKTLIYEDYKLYENKHWRADIFTMTNHQTNKETILEFKNYDFNIELSESDFSQAALKRAK